MTHASALPTALPEPAPVGADTIANLIWKLESQLDEAFATSGRLAMQLPLARVENKLPAIVGQQAFELLGQAMVAIGAARGHTVAGHRVLEKIGRSMGYETSYGDTQPKPDEFMPTGASEVAPLRVVA